MSFSTSTMQRKRDADQLWCIPLIVTFFFILLYYADSVNLTIYLDTGTGKQRLLINVSALATSLGKENYSALFGLYVFTGEDCTSAFKGKGKVLRFWNKKVGFLSKMIFFFFFNFC